MKKLMTAVLAVCPKILAGGGRDGAASLRQCLPSPVSGSTGRERQLNRFNRPSSLRAEVCRPHTGREPRTQRRWWVCCSGAANPRRNIYSSRGGVTMTIRASPGRPAGYRRRHPEPARRRLHQPPRPIRGVMGFQPAQIDLHRVRDRRTWPRDTAARVGRTTRKRRPTLRLHPLLAAPR